MKGVDTRMGRGVPNSGDSAKAADPVSVFPSQMSLPGFMGDSPRTAHLQGPEDRSPIKGGVIWAQNIRNLQGDE